MLYWNRVVIIIINQPYTNFHMQQQKYLDIELKNEVIFMGNW